MKKKSSIYVKYKMLLASLFCYSINYLRLDSIFYCIDAHLNKIGLCDLLICSSNLNSCPGLETSNAIVTKYWAACGKMVNVLGICYLQQILKDFQATPIGYHILTITESCPSCVRLEPPSSISQVSNLSPQHGARRLSLLSGSKTVFILICLF